MLFHFSLEEITSFAFLPNFFHKSFFHQNSKHTVHTISMSYDMAMAMAMEFSSK